MADDTFARRLLDALKTSGVTQAGLARAADIDQSSISRYLRGQCEPNLRQFRSIARALRRRPAELLPGEGEEPLYAVAVNGYFVIFRGRSMIGEWRGALELFREITLLEGRDAERRLEGAGLRPRAKRRK